MARNGIKTGGRQKGTPNKTTSKLKHLVSDFISENWEQVIKDFKSKKLHPRDRLSFIEKLLKYAVPVMGSVNGAMQIKSQLDTLSDDELQKVAEAIVEHYQEQEDAE